MTTGIVELPVGRPFAQQRDAVGIRHPDVEQHQRRLLALAVRARLARVLGERRPDSLRPAGSRTAARGCRLRRRRSGFLSACAIGPGPHARRRGPAARNVHGKHERHARAAAGRVVEDDATAVLVDDLLHDGEAQTRCLSPWWSRTARMRARARRRAKPGPPSANASVASPSRGRTAMIAKRGSANVGLGIDRVLNEIVEHLAQAGGLALDDRGARPARIAQRGDPDCRTERARRARGPARSTLLHLPGPRLPRIDREIVDHVLHRADLRHDRLRAAPQRLRVGALELAARA